VILKEYCKASVKNLLNSHSSVVTTMLVFYRNKLDKADSTDDTNQSMNKGG